MAFEVFISPRKMVLPQLPSKPLNFPTLPKEFHKNQRKLTDTQIAKAKKMLVNNSQRYVAAYFHVSRHVIRMHCVEGYAERYRKTYKHIPANPDTTKVSRNRRRQLIKQLKPDEVKSVQRSNNLYYRKKRDAH